MVMDLRYLREFYSGKKVFITGHTGFKGSWLSSILIGVGADVMGYSLPAPEGPGHFNLLQLEKKLHNIYGDIRDAEHLASSLIDFEPEYVFHLAAQALVRPSYERPVDTFSTNVMGSVSLLEAVRRCSSVRSLVYITSDKCYENVEWIWGYRENDVLGGRDPYSASKAAAEIVFSSYARSFFSQRNHLGAASTRAGNVIGGGDWAVDRIIPDCVRQICGERPIKLRNPRATRPWQHVLEPLSGYLLLATKLFKEPSKWSGAWNFGPQASETRTVEDVARAIVGHLGRGQIDISPTYNQLHEANLLQLNCDKAGQLLGWFPRWGVDQTLKFTADWYKEYMMGNDVAKVSWAQVTDYFGSGA